MTAEDKRQQKDTEEGFGRLDALNRIGNQVFSQDLALSGVGGFEKNLHAQDAPSASADLDRAMVQIRAI